jgi:integration host factor subunit beta
MEESITRRPFLPGSYTVRNSKTGERVKIKPKKLPFFQTGKELKERVNR